MEDSIKLIILDGGGTIWYSMDILWKHYQDAFEKFKLLSPKEFEERFPFKDVTLISSLQAFNSRRNMPKALLAMYSTNTKPDDVLHKSVNGYEGIHPEDCLNDLYSKFCAKNSKIVNLNHDIGEFLVQALDNYDDNKYPECNGACEGIKQLYNSGYKLAVLSNRKLSSTERILKNFKIFDYFDYVEAPSDWAEPVKKPVNQILLRYKIDLNNPIEAIFIGDSNLDIHSAHDHLLFTIAVRGGMGDDIVWDLEQPNPAERVDSLKDVPKLLSEISPSYPTKYKKHFKI